MIRSETYKRSVFIVTSLIVIIIKAIIIVIDIIIVVQCTLGCVCMCSYRPCCCCARHSKSWIFATVTVGWRSLIAELREGNVGVCRARNH